MHLRALVAEATGTFVILTVLFATWLLVPAAGASPWPAAAAVGMAVTATTYALGQVSGGHFNPAITVGLIAGGRFDAAQAPAFIIAQLVGAGLAAGFVYLLAVQAPPGSGAGTLTFADTASTFGGRAHASLYVAVASEIVFAAILMLVFMGATAHTSLTPLAPIAIGLSVTFCYVIAIPLTNAGLNPARSTAAVLFAGPRHIAQLWIFWLAPLAGACLGGLLARYLQSED
jgi:aquaporin Z